MDNVNANVTLDPSIDVAGLMTAPARPASEPVKQEVAEEKKESTSPLDQMMSKSKPSGFESEGPAVNEDEPEVLVSTFQSKEREQDFAEAVNENDALIEKAKLVGVIRKPQNRYENAEMISEISQVTIDPETGHAVVPEGAKYIIPKYIAEATMKKEGSNVPAYEEANITAADIADAKKMTYVKILIDKTGLGANVDFTEEEKSVMEMSSAIHLVEVEDRELRYIDCERVDEDEPFIESIEKYQLDLSKVPTSFPGSGFRAEMCGLSWAEYSDITLDVRPDSTDYLDFDKVNRKFSIIYKKMINCSIGLFKDYEDFLKKFAYADVPFATYGLLVATEPDTDTLTMRCRTKSCGKSFNARYAPRSIINWEDATTGCLQKIEEVNQVTPEKATELAEKSAVRTVRRFKMPKSGIYVEIGLASCYDYLYGILGLINKWTEEDLSSDDARWELVGILHHVRAVIIPTTNGGRPKRYTSPRNIVEAVATMMPTDDVKVLSSLCERFAQDYIMHFSLKNIQCPHCGTKSPAITVTPDDLVFRVFQRQRSSEIMLDNFQTF